MVWNDFHGATAGAAAALTGLIFIGISISLTKILATPSLPTRAFISILLLLTILIVSLLWLVPGQSIFARGVEQLLVGGAAWIAITLLDLNSLLVKEQQYKGRYIFNMVLDQLALMPYLIGGMGMFASGAPNMALYWIVPAVVFSFIKAVLDAWVLLIEINR